MAKTLYKDFDLSFDLDASGDIRTVINENAVSQALRIILETNRGFRPGDDYKNFGSSIRRFIFTNVNPYVARKMGENIKQQLERYEPRLEVLSVDITNENDKNYVIDVKYKTRVSETREVQTYRTVVHAL